MNQEILIKGDTRLFTYKMTHDSGFAPNPFFDVLTLATCKPGIRKTKTVGDWIAGFSSNSLSNQATKMGVNIHPNALIYIAQVSEVIPLGDYFQDKRFRKKIPPPSANDKLIECAGDNIYQKISTDINGQPIFRQVSQVHHNSQDCPHDIAGRNALICKEFYYLGRSGVIVPEHILISRPTGPTHFGYKNTNAIQVNSLLSWVKNNFKKGFNDYPCLWRDTHNETCGRC